VLPELATPELELPVLPPIEPEPVELLLPPGTSQWPLTSQTMLPVPQ
jgi:hypothetical protein